MTTVLHVTEAMGGGVITALSGLVRRQQDCGLDIIVLHTRRVDTPDLETLRHHFPPTVRLVQPPEALGHSRVRQLRWLIKEMRTRAREVDVVHLHSSIAGAVGRCLFAHSRRIRKSLYYSPHGLSFLRADISSWTRAVFRFTEKTLAKLGGTVVLSSPSEESEVRAALSLSHTFVLQNGVDVERLQRELEPERAHEKRDRLRVVMAGRITYAKAPWRFAEAARRLSGKAEFVWLGGGDKASIDEWISDAPVQISGWLPHTKLLNELDSSDLIFFASLWEGMPMALMEAQALGLPAVATNVVGIRDVVVHGETGMLGTSEEELYASLEMLIDEEERRTDFSLAARRHAADLLTDARLGEESLRVYGVES